MSEKKRPQRKKEMRITMKSDPLKAMAPVGTRPPSERSGKQRGFRKKGTRGASWMG